MRKIAYTCNSFNVDQIYPKFDTGIDLYTPNTWAEFQPDHSTHVQVIVIFAKCAKTKRRRRKKMNFFRKFDWMYLRNGWKVSSNLECGLTWEEVNLVSFVSDITELQMHENHDFVVPVNILTPFTSPTFSWATHHTKVCLDAHTNINTPWCYSIGRLYTLWIQNALNE